MPTDRSEQGYGQRKRTSLAGRHERHTVKVSACPRCYPGSVTIGASGDTRPTVEPKEEGNA